MRDRFEIVLQTRAFYIQTKVQPSQVYEATRSCELYFTHYYNFIFRETKDRERQAQSVHKVPLQFQKFITKANETTDKWKLLQNEMYVFKFLLPHLIRLCMGAVRCTKHVKTVLLNYILLDYILENREKRVFSLNLK